MTDAVRPLNDAAERRRSALSELADRAATGDTEATGQLLKALAPSMIRSAQQLLGSTHADLDDVVQQSLIGLVQALPGFRGECSVHHFASRIVARTAVATRRRGHVRMDRQDDSIDVDSLERLPDSTTDRVDAERRRDLVRGLMSTLPPEQAETLALRIVLGFSLEEVATTTGVPLNTVRSRVRLAKTALKKRIEADPRLLEALEVES
jgi:RNA polymerase sigma-70 factor (ECF subfamily)